MGANIGTTLGNGLIALPLGPPGLLIAGIFALVYAFAKSELDEKTSRWPVMGFALDFLWPQPDDRWIETAPQHAGSHVGDIQPERVTTSRD